MKFHVDNIGEEIQSLRNRLWYTQRQLADLVKLSRLSIIKMENGETKHLKNISRVIDTLASTPEYKEINEDMDMVLHKV